MSMRIKKGDQVTVNTGKDKGKEGEVIMIPVSYTHLTLPTKA